MPATYHMTMDKTKETKGTVVFTERVDEDQRPHTFYILKPTFQDLGEPETMDVKLTIPLTEEG